MRFVIPFGLSALWMAASVTAASAPSEFQIYSYASGSKVGGLPLFSSGGQAFFGDHTKTNDSQAAPVVFTESNGKWLGSPNTTDASNSSAPPSWSNFTFAVPAPGSSSHSVQLLNGTSNSSYVTNKFTFYGSYVFVTSSTGAMESLWYIQETSTDGIYSLGWNDTSSDTSDKLLATLKITPPSNSNSKN